MHGGRARHGHVLVTCMLVTCMWQGLAQTVLTASSCGQIMPMLDNVVHMSAAGRQPAGCWHCLVDRYSEWHAWGLSIDHM
jgi:hypothetical protein